MRSKIENFENSSKKGNVRCMLDFRIISNHDGNHVLITHTHTKSVARYQVSPEDGPYFFLIFISVGPKISVRWRPHAKSKGRLTPN